MSEAGTIFRDDGKGGLVLVGDFEGLYQCSPDPWGQSGSRADNASYYRFSRHRLAVALAAHIGGREGCRLEIGCGLGHAMDHAAAATGGHWTGIDISPTAIAKARLSFPAHDFHVADIRDGLPLPPSSVGKYDVVILSQLLWYVLQTLDKAVANAIRLTSIGGLLVVHQAFLREQIYGREIIDGFGAALRYLTGRFVQLRLIEAHYDDGDTHVHHDGLLIFRKVSHA